MVRSFLSNVPTLLNWVGEHGRVYPWRTTQNPWQVYIAEILLQRTRGDLVEPVYRGFVSTYPTPRALYEASESEIYEQVQTLGFGNQRTRTLQEVARIICEEFDEQVPRDLESLQRPWRVGTYCSRATLLFAFDEPMALVDGNFARVFGRVFDYEMPSQPHKSSQVFELVSGVTPDNPDLARAFNLAILDLGALICTSNSPECERCPVQEACAYAEQHR
ncbi:hypothetical protein [Haloarchaeobius sp. TZWSO28]|uniref:hypothetical protein n=1 Tax=Haloarchaeobius sp. TZWSO28 TaxID=3446119 RepID=UPI003EB92C73